jgi:integrase
MPRSSKGARLWLRPATDRNAAVWIIKDGRRSVRTGCGPADREAAEKRLADYIAAKYEPGRSGNQASQIPVADVLNIYMQDKAAYHTRPHETAARIERLLLFFANYTLADVKGPLCRAYAKKRGSQSAARRELEDLRAAIVHHRKEGLCDQVIDVVLPPKPEPRERWLSRSEAARLLWSAWRRSPHVARFILVALYTGSRSGAVLGASLLAVSGRGYVDVDKGVFYRKAFGARRTNKRQPPVPIPDRLLAHIRRWKRLRISVSSLIEYQGKPVGEVSHAFRRAARAAGLDGVCPHTLRHTAATWMVENGAETTDIARFLGMSEAMVEERYGHTGSKSLARAAEALTRRR